MFADLNSIKGSAAPGNCSGEHSREKKKQNKKTHNNLTIKPGEKKEKLKL